jgi:hypothetical protein
MALVKKILLFEKSQKGEERRQMQLADYSLVRDVRSHVPVKNWRMFDGIVVYYMP